MIGLNDRIPEMLAPKSHTYTRIHTHARVQSFRNLETSLHYFFTDFYLEGF